MLIYLKTQGFVIKKIKKLYNYDHILNNYLLYVAIERYMWQQAEMCGSRSQCVALEKNMWQYKSVCGTRGKCVVMHGNVWH